MSNKRYIKANIDEEEIVETPTTETEEINKKNNYKKGDMVRL